MAKTSTIRDVAALAGVSIGTVSNYLTGKKPVSQPAGERIASAIQKLRFVPNTAVRVVRGGRAPAVALVVPDAANPFFAEVARGVDEVASRHGMVVITCNTNSSIERERFYLRNLSEMRIRGVLVTPVSEESEHIRQFQDAGGTVVILDSPSRSFTAPAVAVDDYSGGRLAVDHLVDTGHQNIVFVGGPGGGAPVEQRFIGARSAWTDRGRNPQDLVRIDVTGTSSRDRAAAADQILRMGRRPSAVFCANDLIALAVLGRLSRLGVRVPEDIAVIGYDDIDAAELASVPLSSVSQPQFDLGHKAAEILIEAESATASVEDVVFIPKLVIRESTAGFRRTS